MGILFGVLVGLIALVILVVIHELGHAVVARRNGVVVEEFGVGFPPTAWSKKLKNGVKLSVNWLPIGGFVKLQGEHDADNKKGDYGAATFWQKTKILLAGVTVNWLFAALLFTVLALFGLPKILPNQFTVPSDTHVISNPVIISNTLKGSPAEKAGLASGDQITQVNNQKVKSLSDFTSYLNQHNGGQVKVYYVRDGKQNSIYTKPELKNDAWVLGVELTGSNEKFRATWSAPIVGIVTAAQFTDESVRGLGSMVASLMQGQTKEVSASVSGPVGILGTLFPGASRTGLGSVILLMALISLALAIMNLLPIPGLDGGRWLTMALFKVSGKKLTKETEDKINGTGMLILLSLMILVTIVDVSKLF